MTDEVRQRKKELRERLKDLVGFAGIGIGDFLGKPVLRIYLERTDSPAANEVKRLCQEMRYHNIEVVAEVVGSIVAHQA